jgi:hypothetical protein
LLLGKFSVAVVVVVDSVSVSIELDEELLSELWLVLLDRLLSDESETVC